jgi:NhaP-type Na+/H+ or K+/H+ antiporter
MLLRAAARAEWFDEEWIEVPVPATAAACFAVAQWLGGSGFIACFAGGLLVSWLAPRRRRELLRGAQGLGETLALLTWVVFGAAAFDFLVGRLTLPVLLYALLSLTAVRMLPVFLCLSQTAMSTAEKLFIGWFGPRGLASIVFGIIVFDEHLPGSETLEAVVALTVLLSVAAHGVTANPLVEVLRKPAEHTAGSERQPVMKHGSTNGG